MVDGPRQSAQWEARDSGHGGAGVVGDGRGVDDVARRTRMTERERDASLGQQACRLGLLMGIGVRPGGQAHPSQLGSRIDRDDPRGADSVCLDPRRASERLDDARYRRRVEQAATLLDRCNSCGCHLLDDDSWRIRWSDLLEEGPSALRALVPDEIQAKVTKTAVAEPLGETDDGCLARSRHVGDLRHGQGEHLRAGADQRVRNPAFGWLQMFSCGAQAARSVWWRHCRVCYQDIKVRTRIHKQETKYSQNWLINEPGVLRFVRGTADPAPETLPGGDSPLTVTRWPMRRCFVIADDQRMIREALTPTAAPVARCRGRRCFLRSRGDNIARSDHGFRSARTPKVLGRTGSTVEALYVQGRGALRRELVACLRTGRAPRVPRARSRGRGKTFVAPEILISQRPAAVEDRAVPGHWEGDLIVGLGSSAIGTLVERTTRFTILLHLPRLEGHGGPRVHNGPALAGHGAEAVRDAIAAAIVTLPEQLRRSLTWDQGAEMAQHAQLHIVTGLRIYFCDPHSPWQRGSNENTNGLLRQYFPKGTDLSRYTHHDLDAVAAALNGRPRKTLDWKTPAEVLNDHILSAQQDSVATTP